MTRILYLKVRWSEKPLSMETFNLAQYIMVNWTLGSRTEVTKKTGNHSIIFLKFKFDRTLGFYILQIYIPLTIIVMSSWVAFWSPPPKKIFFVEVQVSFWLIKTDMGHETAARTGLGATSTLAVVTIGFGGKTKPQVILQQCYKYAILYSPQI